VKRINNKKLPRDEEIGRYTDKQQRKGCNGWFDGSVAVNFVSASCRQSSHSTRLRER
jgi:hypothetical protein